MRGMRIAVSWVSPSLSPFLTQCPPPVSSVRPQRRKHVTDSRFNRNYTIFTENWPYYWKQCFFTFNTIFSPSNQNKEFHFRICGNLNPFADRSRINIRTVYSRSQIFFSKLNIQSQWEFPAKTVGTPDLPGPDFWLWIHRWIDKTNLLLRGIDKTTKVCSWKSVFFFVSKL